MSEILPEPDILLDLPPTPEIPLPKGWSDLTLQAVLHIISLARIVILNAVNWPDGPECDTLSPDDLPSNESETTGNHEVQAWWPDHVWSGDLTEVSTSNGFWCPWSPFAVPQQFPYCWWIYVVIDHFSRRIMGVAIFKTQSAAEDICREMDRICIENVVKPKYFVSDQGKQFDSLAFRSWCSENSVKNRYGAVGTFGSIAVTERVIKSVKYEYLNHIVVPLSQSDMENEV